MQPESSGVKTWQWVVTVIVVIVLIIIGIMVFGGKSKTPMQDEVPSDTTAVNTGVNSIILSDQYPGNVVYVSSVQLANAGWVVIHKDQGGEPGAVIGQVYVGAGINPAKVTLSSPLVDGGTYYAMLHADDGDKKWDAALDLPLKDSKGSIIMRVFHGSATADANIKG